MSHEMTGFTPIPDVIAHRYGLNCAAVWGLIWRYSQMESGWCTASVETMAERIGIDRKTVQKYLQQLLRPDDGDAYIEARPRPGFTTHYRPTYRLTFHTALSIVDGGKRPKPGAAPKTKQTVTPDTITLDEIPAWMGGTKT